MAWEAVVVWESVVVLLVRERGDHKIFDHHHSKIRLTVVLVIKYLLEAKQISVANQVPDRLVEISSNSELK